MAQKFCTACGAPLGEDMRRFCTRCGAPIAEPLDMGGNQHVDQSGFDRVNFDESGYIPGDYPPGGYGETRIANDQTGGYGAGDSWSGGTRPLDNVQPVGDWQQNNVPPNPGMDISRIVIAASAAIVAIVIIAFIVMALNSKPEPPGPTSSTTVVTDSSSSSTPGGTGSDSSSSATPSSAGGASSSSARSDDEAIYQTLDEAYSAMGGQADRIKDTAATLNNTIFTSNRSARQSAADDAKRLKREVSDQLDELKRLSVPSDSKYYSSQQTLIELQQDLYNRIDVMCQAWDISLQYDTPKDHESAIKKPLGKDNDSNGVNVYKKDFESRYPSARPTR